MLKMSSLRVCPWNKDPVLLPLRPVGHKTELERQTFVGTTLESPVTCSTPYTVHVAIHITL